MKSKTLITVFFFAISLTAFSQKVKFDDGLVLVDGVQILQHVSKAAGMNNTFSDLTGKKQFFIDEVHAGSGPKTWYLKIYFIDSNLKMTIKTVRKDAIRKLLEEQVINKDGTLNLENTKIFVSRYDAHIE